MATDIERGKARGWVTLTAGGFIIVLISGIWLFIRRAFADGHLTVSTRDTATFLGQTFVAFALIFLCGVLGIANGVMQLRTGRRSVILNGAIIVLVGSALVVIWIATSSNKS